MFPARVRPGIGGGPSAPAGNRRGFSCVQESAWQTPRAAATRRRPGSGRKPLAPVGAAARQDLAAFFRGHAVAEAVPALADDFARLIGALHDKSPQKKPKQKRRTRLKKGAVLLSGRK